MATASTPPQASGVQELIDRIRAEGVSQARAEADEILRAAREEATAMRTRADEEARALLAETRERIASEHAAGIDALKNAARDSLLEMENNVRRSFEAYVARLVAANTRKPEFVRSLIFILAGQAAEQFIEDQDAKIFVSAALAEEGADGTQLPEAIQQKICDVILGIGGEVLREGVELLPDDTITGGARVRLVHQKIEIDMTDRALTRVLLKHLLPRYREIVAATT